MWRGMEDYGPCGRGGVRKIERLWRRARGIDRFVTARLECTLITPIDAEDIRTLSIQLNSILESLTKAAWEQSTLQVRSVPYPLTRMYERAFSVSKQLVQAVSSLPRGNPLTAFSLTLRDNRQKVRHCERTLLADLMEREADPIQLMKWRNIYQGPQTILTRFSDTALTLDKVKLKNN